MVAPNYFLLARGPWQRCAGSRCGRAIFDRQLTDCVWVVFIRPFFGFSLALGQSSRRIRRYPPGSTPEEERASFTALLGDEIIDYGGWAWSERVAASNRSPVYRYYFTRRPPGAPELSLSPLTAPSVYHSAELYYVFNTLHVRNWPWEPDDRSSCRCNDLLLEQLCQDRRSKWTRLAAMAELQTWRGRSGDGTWQRNESTGRTEPRALRVFRCAVSEGRNAVGSRVIGRMRSQVLSQAICPPCK
jgi:hypothetical protein